MYRCTLWPLLQFLNFSSRIHLPVVFVGWMTDNMGTYNMSFVASGVGICFSGFLLLVAPLLRRCDHVAVNNDKKSEENSDQETSPSKTAADENLPSTSWNSN